MFFKVTLTFMLLFESTNQGQIMSWKNPMHLLNQSNDYFGHDANRNARQFDYINKWFGNNHQIGRYQNTHHKSRFSEVMNFILSTPDYGLKYTEDQQRQRFEFPSFPGFHNLIEVRGPTRYRYIPNRLKEYVMPSIPKLNKNKKKPKDYDTPRIHKQIKNKMKTRYQVLPKSSELQPKQSNQLDDGSFSKEGFSIWDFSQESCKRNPGDLIKNIQLSTPMLKFNERRHYLLFTTAAGEKNEEIAATPRNPNEVSFVAPDVFDKIDPLPYKQVKTRNQEPDSDEEEEDERSKYLEFY